MRDCKKGGCCTTKERSSGVPTLPLLQISYSHIVFRHGSLFTQINSTYETVHPRSTSLCFVGGGIPVFQAILCGIGRCALWWCRVIFAWSWYASKLCHKVPQSTVVAGRGPPSTWQIQRVHLIGQALEFWPSRHRRRRIEMSNIPCGIVDGEGSSLLVLVVLGWRLTTADSKTVYDYPVRTIEHISDIS